MSAIRNGEKLELTTHTYTRLTDIDSYNEQNEAKNKKNTKDIYNRWRYRTYSPVYPRGNVVNILYTRHFVRYTRKSLFLTQAIKSVQYTGFKATGRPVRGVPLYLYFYQIT